MQNGSNKNSMNLIHALPCQNIDMHSFYDIKLTLDNDGHVWN